MKNKRATLGQIAFIFIGIVLIIALLKISPNITGFTAHENLEVFPGKDLYITGEMAHIFVSPDNIDYSVEVYIDDILVAMSSDFIVEQPGNYTIKAIAVTDSGTREAFSSFTVIPDSLEEPLDNLSAEPADDYINMSETPAEVSTPKNLQPNSGSAGVQIAPVIGNKLKDEEGNTVGEKIKDEDDYETFFEFIGKTDNRFVIRFHHNSKSIQPVWVEETKGKLDYKLSKLSAKPNETINLTVDSDSKSTEFTLHIGTASEAFMFNINGLESSTSKISKQDINNEDMSFSKSDMTEGFELDEPGNKTKITKIEKQGIKIEIKGAGKNDIGNINWRKGVLHADGMIMEKAKIRIPHDSIPKIGVKPKLYIKEDNETEFRPAEVYEKNGTIYNSISILPEYYEYEVEHFTSYIVNTSGGDYSSIQACLDAKNDTASCCYVNEIGYTETLGRNIYTIGDSNCAIELRGNYSDIDFNYTTLIAKTTGGGETGITAEASPQPKSLSISNIILKDYDTNIATNSNDDSNLTNISTFNGSDNINGLRINASHFSSRNSKGVDINDGNSYFYDMNITNVNQTTPLNIPAYSPYNTFKRLNITVLDGTSNQVMISTAYNGLYHNFTDIYVDCYSPMLLNTLIKKTGGGTNPGINIKNSIIKNCWTGIDALRGGSNSLTGLEGTVIVNNTFTGGGRAAILIGDNDVFANNTVNQSGTEYLTSYSKFTYNGIQFDDYLIYIWNGGATSQSISSDDTAISGATGSNKWRLILYNEDASGPSAICANCNSTLLVDDSYPYTCAFIVGVYGGQCWDWYEAFTPNGLGSNYTWNTSVDATVIGGYTDPPYLKADNVEQMLIRSFYSNITGNIITGPFAPEYSMNITGNNSNIWLNSFYRSGIIDTGTGNSFCVGGEGNFYEESLTPVTGDCGPANITTPANASYHSPKLSSSMNTAWTNQSSTETITYYLQYSNDSGATWNHLTSTSSLAYSWDISSFAENDTYVLKIIPNDGLYNGTNVYSYFTIDNTDPSVFLMSPNDLANLTDPNITFTFNATDNIAGTLNCSLFFNSTHNQNNESILNNTVSGFSLIGLTDGDYWWNITCWDFAGNPNSSENRSFILDSTPPTITDMIYIPNSTGGIDPLTTINVSSNASDLHGVLTSTLQYKRGVGSYTNVSMDYNSTTGRWNASFTTDAISGNYTIRIMANDSFGNINTSGGISFDSEYDYTWNRTPADFGTTQGVVTSSDMIGNLTINNTGDDTLSFDLSDNSPYGVSYNVTEPFLLAAGGIKAIQVNATFASSNREDSFNITITASHSPTSPTPASEKVSATIISFTGGPYLQAEIVSPPSIVFQSNTFNLTAKIKNLGNETANNTLINWTIPSGWENISGNLTYYIGNITPAATTYSNITIYTNPSTSDAGTVIVYFNSSSDNNVTASKSASITVYCNVTDGVCGKSCTTSLDPNCATPVIDTSARKETGGGGGGSGVSAPISSGKIVEGPTQAIEIVKGSTFEFPIAITNTYENAVIEDVTIDIKGYIPQYISVKPAVISRIDYQETKEFTVNVEAPSYMKFSNHTMNVTIEGDIVTKTEQNETLKTRLIDRRMISLVVQEVSRDDAQTILQESASLIKDMENAGFNTRKISKLYDNAAKYFDARRYHLVTEIGNDIEQTSRLAFETHSMIIEIKDSIDEAESRGLKVIETKNLLNLAQIAFNREDYEASQQRIKDAQFTLLVETKGKFNIINFVQKHYPEILGIIVLITIISILIYARIKSALILKKMKYLDKSEVTISELITQAQKDCFDLKKMTVLEYHKAMYEYNKRLEKIRHQRISLRSKRIGLIKVSNELENLKRENDYLLELIRQVQEDYFKTKRSDWDTYTSKMDALSSRRAEVEKGLAMLEAKALLEKRKKGEKISLEDIEKELSKVGVKKKDIQGHKNEFRRIEKELPLKMPEKKQEKIPEQILKAVPAAPQEAKKIKKRGTDSISNIQKAMQIPRPSMQAKMQARPEPAGKQALGTGKTSENISIAGKSEDSSKYSRLDRKISQIRKDEDNISQKLKKIREELDKI